MTTSDGRPRVPRANSTDDVATPRPKAMVDRATELVDALALRALRHERVLEVLDLRAARSARKLAQRLEAAAQSWASEREPFARSTKGTALFELMEAAEMVLLAGDAPAPSTERPVPPESTVEPTNDVQTEERDRVENDDLGPSTADASAWLSMLGVPPRRRR